MGAMYVPKDNEIHSFMPIIKKWHASGTGDDDDDDDHDHDDE